jgi:CubicO group peptidase (beta-lactamase class C family)
VVNRTRAAKSLQKKGLSRTAALYLLVSSMFIPFVGARAHAVAPTELDFKKCFEDSAIHGAAVAFLQANTTTVYYHGYTDAASSVPVTARTRFRAGSISKLFTSLLVLRAQQAGVLKLTDSVERWLPGSFGGRSDVRIEHLLEHTAGLEGSSYAEYGAQTPGLSPTDYVEANRAFRLRWNPGIHYSYANGGHTIAAAVMEKAWNADFDTLMQREVLIPLGMHHSSFENAGDIEHLTDSFHPAGKPALKWAMPVRPSGALVTTADDLMKAVHMLLHRGRLPDGTRFLEQSLVERMERGETSLAGRAGAAQGSYGLGSFPFLAGERLYRGHWGATEGFLATLGYSSASQSGFVVLSNTRDKRAMHRLRKLLGGSSPAEQALTRVEPAHCESGRPGRQSIKTDKSWNGLYVLHTHDMIKRSWLFALMDAHRIAVTQNGIDLGSPWHAGTRHFIHCGDRLYRDETMPVATATLARIDGKEFFVNHDSFRKISALSFYGQWIILGAGLTVSLIGLALILVRVLRRKHGPGEGWIALAAIATLLLIGLFVGKGILGGMSSCAALARPSCLSIALLVSSLLLPVGAVIALLRSRRRPLCLTAAGAQLLFAALLAIHGWLPFITWN